MWLNFLQLGSAELKTAKSTSVSRLVKLEQVVGSPRNVSESVSIIRAQKKEH